MVLLWSILGDALLVRSKASLQSQTASHRLQHAAVVEEVELLGDRLHYMLVTGTGPPEGWITVRTKERVLAERLKSKTEQLAAQVPQAARIVKPLPPKAPAQEFEGPPLATGCVQQISRAAQAGKPLAGYPAPGDVVSMRTTSESSWVDACVVQEAIVKDTRVDGRLLPQGSVLVCASNETPNSQWITPAEQPVFLKRPPVPKALDLQVGIAVLVWSVNGRRWHSDGVISSKAAQDIVLESIRISKDSVLVVYNEGIGVKWIAMEQQPELLRAVPIGEETAKQTAAVVATEGFRPHGPVTQIVLQPLLILEPSEQVDVFTWYGDLFGYIYGRKSDSSEGWFPGKIVRLLEGASVIEDAQHHEIGDVEEDKTAVQEAPCESIDVDVAEEDGAIGTQQEAKRLASIVAQDKQDLGKSVPAAASKQQKWVDGMEPILAKRLAEQQAKVQSGMLLAVTAASPPKLERPAVQMESALATLLNRQLRKSEGLGLSLKSGAKPQLESGQAEVEQAEVHIGLKPSRERKQAGNSIAITDSGLAKRLEQQRAKIEGGSKQVG